MVLFKILKNNGRELGRCDAKCYKALPGSECHCVCGGMNHAKGFKVAQKNTFEMLTKKRDVSEGIIKISDEVLQLDFFEVST